MTCDSFIALCCTWSFIRFSRKVIFVPQRSIVTACAFMYTSLLTTSIQLMLRNLSFHFRLTSEIILPRNSFGVAFSIAFPDHRRKWAFLWGYCMWAVVLVLSNNCTDIVGYCVGLVTGTVACYCYLLYWFRCYFVPLLLPLKYLI